MDAVVKTLIPGHSGSLEAGVSEHPVARPSRAEAEDAEPVETTPWAEVLGGGEGVEILAAPPHHTTHSGSQKIFTKGHPSTPSPEAP